ncbi:hypothetical protein [Candidatus Albibeggiatoa sp. nov. BB20]|uniref:hypothetical protein n=1 Tax=Candidatus Albibeggiatoa sp. nov. BB20 TaxID=3162723 RepID=UPI0033657F13
MDYLVSFLQVALSNELAVVMLVAIGTAVSILRFSLKYLENKNEEATDKYSNVIDDLNIAKGNDTNQTNTAAKDHKTQILNILQMTDGKYIEVLIHVQNLKGRLNIQLANLSSNRNLNLLIGLTATIIAIMLLVVFVFIETKPTDLKMLAFHYGTRFSIVIFVEIFALFFLRLYKTNLFEIKYFQNELTNIDCKIIALKTAIYLDDKTAIRAILKELSNTERNHLLKKGETTVELERVKIEKNESKQLLENLMKLLQEKKNK